MFNKLATLAKAGLKLLENAPVGGLIKAGVLIGVAGFTCWVMIKRTLKMRKEAQESESGLFRSPVDDLLNNNYVANPDAYDDLDPEARRICKELNKSWKKSRKSKKKKASKKERAPKVVSLFNDDADPNLFDPDAEEDEDEEKEVADVPRPTSVLDMLIADDKKRAKRSANPDRVRRIRKNIRKRKDTAREKMRALCQEWKDSGCADAKAFRAKVDQIARDLNLPVDDLDDDIPDSFKEAHPSLF